MVTGPNPEWINLADSRVQAIRLFYRFFYRIFYRTG